MDNIDNFINTHRNKLQADKDSLVINKLESPNNKKKCALKENKEINCTLLINNNDEIENSTTRRNNENDELQYEYNNNNNNKNAIMDFLQLNNNANEPLTNRNVCGVKAGTEAGCVQQQQQLMQSPQPTTANMCSVNFPFPMATTSPSTVLNQQNTPREFDNNSNFQIYDNLGHNKYFKHDNNNFADKTTKNLTNLNERQSAVAADHTNISAANSKQRVNKDDMEQWVSDTFYSYFPGYNNENKKRQDILRDRQLEYQQNYLRHQMNEAAANSGKKKYSHSHNKNNNNNNNPEEKLEQNIPNSETINHNKPPPPTTATSRSSDKTDLEIIVNNPDYEIRSPRPGSARHRLLQDLKHTEISNIVNNDGVTERNRRNAEMEMAKKKDYQKELMAQIEEHRRSIEMLKEKERRQDEALTKKLEEQIKTMRLQEELEKEKMRADKMRFDSEQNRLMREHLLTKLENDTKVLDATVRKSHSENNDKIIPAKNKVYKYFSNSARHEFRRDANHEQPAFHLDLPQSNHHNRQKKCFHDLSNDTLNICPFCDSTLKSYESWCLKCERRIFDTNPAGENDPLVCANCKKFYSICSNCDREEGTNCIHCHRKQNFCSSCRKTLCTDCIDEIAIGKDNSISHRHKADSERSFEILEVNYPEHDDEAANDFNNNQQNDHQNRPPYSINIDRNSIFHHDFDQSKLYDDENSIEEIRHETDKQLSRYLKNYGDLACKGLRDRSTQTTPDTASRRDIVMVEENNLSMPLLREMPRMTRKESNFQQAERKKKGTRIENLARRWEVPAVQKHTITTNSPKVLTQLGAIRRQLQSEQLHLNF